MANPDVRRPDERLNWATSTPFFVVHLVCLAAIFTGVPAPCRKVNHRGPGSPRLRLFSLGGGGRVGPWFFLPPGVAVARPLHGNLVAPRRRRAPPPPPRQEPQLARHRAVHGR